MRPQNFQQRLKPLWTVLFSHYLQRHRDWKFIEEPKRRTLFVQKSLHEYCQSSWPEKRALDISITPYWKVRGSITVYFSTTNALSSHVPCNKKHSIEFTRATRVSNAVECVLRLRCGGQASRARLQHLLKIVLPV